MVDKVDIALPCATQNEVGEDDVSSLKEAGCRILAEGSNMSCASSAIKALHKEGIEYGPAKAANAGAQPLTASGGFAVQISVSRCTVQAGLLL